MLKAKAVARQFLDWVRHVRFVNAVGTSLGRRLVPRGPVRRLLVDHLPRDGEVRIPLPYGSGRHQLYLQSGSDWLTSRIWWDGVDAFEPEVGPYFAQVAKDAGGVLDIGAYTGWYSLVAATLNHTANIIAFEANPIIVNELRGNVELNGFNNVSIVQCAVSDGDGQAKFYLGGEGLASSSSLESEWRGLHQTIEVVTRSVDSVLTEFGNPRVDLVKMDIEGSESRAIMGMRKTISLYHPVIFVELLRNFRAGFLDSFEFLVGEGYELFECTVDSLRHIEQGTEAFMSADSKNFVVASPTSAGHSLLAQYFDI
jgi:FkbM family methyltransferase